MGVTVGRLLVSCMPVKFLIQIVYVNSADDRNRLIYEIDTGTGLAPVSGDPVWMTSDRYDIEAKAEANPRGQMMQGSMLRALLEDCLLSRRLVRTPEFLSFRGGDLA